MYIVIDLHTYRKLRNLSFAPQVDLTNNNLPINEYTVDIVTDDAIPFGYADLYDDIDNLWAHYYISKVERISADVQRVYARSDLALIDGVTLPAKMYTGQTAAAVMDEVMICQVGGGLYSVIDYTLDTSLQSITITGFCPEQSARERLQWLCVVLGAYVKTAFNAKPEILPIDTTAALIPVNKTFLRPSVQQSEVVTAVRVLAYSFAQGTPSTTDAYVTDAFGVTYIVTSTEVMVDNSAAPSSAPDNVKSIEGLYLINSNNASAVLSFLAARYFKPITAQLDVIDNAEYVPGDMATIHADRDLMYTGYIDSAAFRFGKQARSTLTLKGVVAVESAALTISYTWEGMTVALETHTLPVGHAYSVSTRYIDTIINGHRYILRPTQSAVTGTLTSEGAAATVTCETALDLFEGVLHIYDVDALSVDANGVVSIT